MRFWGSLAAVCRTIGWPGIFWADVWNWLAKHFQRRAGKSLLPFGYNKERNSDVRK